MAERVVKCRFCNSDVPAEARFCQMCGASMAQASAPSKRAEEKALPAPPGENLQAPVENMYSPSGPEGPGRWYLDHPDKVNPEAPQEEIISFAPVYMAKFDALATRFALMVLAGVCYLAWKPDFEEPVSYTLVFALSLMVVALVTFVMSCKEWFTRRLGRPYHGSRMFVFGGATISLLVVAIYTMFSRSGSIGKWSESTGVLKKSPGFFRFVSELLRGDYRHVLALAVALAFLYFLSWVLFRLFWDHMYFHYRITNAYVEISRGIIDYNDDSIHMQDVRDVRLRQTIGDKLFDVGRITLLTSDPQSVKESDQPDQRFVEVTLLGVPEVRKVHRLLKNINQKCMSKFRRLG